MTAADEELTLDATTFTAAERLEVQTRFDAPFGELLACVLESISLDPDRPSRIVEGRNGRAWPDQIIQHMLWVQARRSDPDATLESFDGLKLHELNRAYIRGFNSRGKAQPTKSTRSRSGRRSAGGSGAD